MRALDNMETGQAEASGWRMLKPLNCEVVGKATYEDNEMNIMKSTKRFKVEGGWIYNTSTEIHKGDQIAIAEALVFVPEIIKSESEQPV